MIALASAEGLRDAPISLRHPRRHTTAACTTGVADLQGGASYGRLTKSSVTVSLFAGTSCAALLLCVGPVEAAQALSDPMLASSTNIARTRPLSMPVFRAFSKGSAADSRKGWTPSKEGAPRKMSQSGYDITPLTSAERAEWISKLTEFQRYVAVDQGTERSFSGTTVNGYPYSVSDPGIYASSIGELPVFSSDTKFDSGTGWPSFYAPIDPEHIIEVKDLSIPFMPRTEIIDARGGAHLGHVFDDGPAPTGKRYCLNAAALKFIPSNET